MPRNRSEKCPAVLRQKMVTPRTWPRPGLVQLIDRSHRSTYIVQIQHHDGSRWHFGVSSSLDLAVAEYEAMVDGFSFNEQAKLHWTYYSRTPRYAT